MRRRIGLVTSWTAESLRREKTTMIFAIIAMCGAVIAAVGFAGRGTKSINIATVGGIIWLAGCVLAFWKLRWFEAGGLVLATLVLANLGERLFRRMMGTTNRMSSWDAREVNERALEERDDLLRLLEERRNESRKS